MHGPFRSRFVHPVPLLSVKRKIRNSVKERTSTLNHSRLDSKCYAVVNFVLVFLASIFFCPVCSICLGFVLALSLSLSIILAKRTGFEFAFVLHAADDKQVINFPSRYRTALKGFFEEGRSAVRIKER